MKEIWDRLYNSIKNEYAVAGIMGNLEAESGLKSNNLQNSYERIVGMNDKQYTEAVNNKTYSKNDFYSDHAGYGLAQWTYWSRKKSLYEFIFNNGYNDISSLNGQIDFLYKVDRSDPRNRGREWLRKSVLHAHGRLSVFLPSNIPAVP